MTIIITFPFKLLSSVVFPMMEVLSHYLRLKPESPQHSTSLYCPAAMDETVFLSSTDLTTSAPQILRHLWTDKDFTDVTLATADDQQIPVHKAILSACSPFLRRLLVTHPHPNPMLYLRGVQVMYYTFFYWTKLKYKLTGSGTEVPDTVHVLGGKPGTEPVPGLLSAGTVCIFTWSSTNTVPCRWGKSWASVGL